MTEIRSYSAFEQLFNVKRFPKLKHEVGKAIWGPQFENKTPFSWARDYEPTLRDGGYQIDIDQAYRESSNLKKGTAAAVRYVPLLFYLYLIRDKSDENKA